MGYTDRDRLHPAKLKASYDAECLATDELHLLTLIPTKRFVLFSNAIFILPRNDFNNAVEEYMALSGEEAAKAEVPLLFISFPSSKDSSHNERYPGKF